MSTSPESLYSTSSQYSIFIVVTTALVGIILSFIGMKLSGTEERKRMLVQLRKKWIKTVFILLLIVTIGLVINTFYGVALLRVPLF